MLSSFRNKSPLQFRHGETEFLQRLNHPLGVVLRNGDPDIQVIGCAWSSDNPDGIAANEQSLHAFIVQ